VILPKTTCAGAEFVSRGDPLSARSAFSRVTAAGAPTSQVWLYQASACEQLRDPDGMEVAVDQVLAAEPGNLNALLMQEGQKCHDAVSGSLTLPNPARRP
jgi:hypothetical protein